MSDELEVRRFSDARPDRFNRFEDYVPPAPDRDRDVDHVPVLLERDLPVYANRGHAHLKRR